MSLYVSVCNARALPGRLFRGVLDAGPGSAPAGRSLLILQRPDVREVLPGDGRVQLLHEPHHLLIPRQGHAQHLQTHPLLPVRGVPADGRALRRALQHARARGTLRERRGPQQQRQTAAQAHALAPELARSSCQRPMLET